MGLGMLSKIAGVTESISSARSQAGGLFFLVCVPVSFLSQVVVAPETSVGLGLISVVSVIM